VGLVKSRVSTFDPVQLYVELSVVPGTEGRNTTIALHSAVRRIQIAVLSVGIEVIDMSKRILLTSVCRPMGPQYGDASSVGYELLYRQVTRAQGIFSPRTVNVHFSLDYIAENLEAPTVVLQYPSKSELIRELKKGYDYVGITFIMAVMHKMKEMVALIRQYAPNTKIVLGGYGTVLKDEVLKPYADYICREEGVGYFRRLLGEPPIPMPYKQPLIVSSLLEGYWSTTVGASRFSAMYSREKWMLKVRGLNSPWARVTCP
jgi:hypothetical protein